MDITKINLEKCYHITDRISLISFLRTFFGNFIKELLCN